MSVIDYSKWKDIEISDDEDDTHPNVDTPSLFRWRHQARLERMAEQKKEKDEVLNEHTAHQRRMKEIRQKLEDACLDVDERSKLEKEVQDLEEQNRKFIEKEEELSRKEKLSPWNVDTIGHDGFSKSRINKLKEPQEPQLTEEEREEKLRNFVNDKKGLIKKFGLLRRFDDSKQFLLDHPELCCEETANFLVVECLNHEMEEKHELMEHMAHQCIIMQYLLELAKQMEVSPQAPQLVSSFFSKIKMADKMYKDAFDDELNAFKERIRNRAKEKIAEAVQEYEEEERQKRLGPGGLDPQEVFEELPTELQKCFELRDTQMLQDVLSALEPEKAEYYLKRCVDSGLWVADASKVSAESSDPLYEETAQMSAEENITQSKGNDRKEESGEIRKRNV